METCCFRLRTSGCCGSGLPEDSLENTHTHTPTEDENLEANHEDAPDKESSLASFGPQVLQPEGLGRLEGEDGVALLDDVQVVVVVAERAMEAVVVHLSQDELERGADAGVGWGGEQGPGTSISAASVLILSLSLRLPEGAPAPSLPPCCCLECEHSGVAAAPPRQPC